MVSADAEPKQGSEEIKKITGKKPLVTVKHTTLYKNSHIIVNRGEHTIIPKRSILVLPDRLKSRVTKKPSGKFVLWPEFKKTNQDWIWTFEVTLDQAKGITPLPEGRMKDLAKLNRVVVALYRGNPVSVLPPRKKDTDKDASKNKPNKEK
ncbi:MAG: hypothetical protein HKP20_08430 [Akkermansiaceae bacterium]|nr:hypothetical protein [Akkermansiaceae bacterium]